METEGTVVAAHFGEWLGDQIAAAGKTQTLFAKEAGVSRSRLNDWIKDAAPPIMLDKLGSIARALGRPYESVKREFDEARLAVVRSLPEPDFNVEKGTMTSLVDIPVFDRELAAGTWTTAIFVDESAVSEAQAQQGLFRVRLRGDSMEPKYKDGCLVEFRVIRVCREGLVEGADFYIQRDDELATFKTVQKIDDELVTLAAINRKRYKSAMVIEKARIVRCARAVAIITDV